MTSRYGSVLTLKVPRKVPQGTHSKSGECSINTQFGATQATQVSTPHRPAVGAKRFGRYKALAGGLIAALKALEDSCEDLPTDRNGNC